MATKKWRESDFCKMSPVHSADTLQVQNFVEISHRFQDECAYALYAEIQEGCQKWRESDFPVVFLHFWQKFENSKWPPLLGSKIF